MKIRTGHLTYCTNIHPGESWSDHFSALKQNFPAIKNGVAPDKPFGIGLRLSNLASLDLISEENQSIFKQWLRENQAYVFTMNGFPYGGFHHTKVKDQVHAPDWTTRERVDYTIRLFQILKNLLPEGMEGSISTSPLSYRPWFRTQEGREEAKNKATDHILLIAEELIRIRRSSGPMMHLDIEPEPDGLLETGTEFIDWYEDYLLKKGQTFIAEKFEVSTSEAEKLLKDHITLCYDVCHFAIGYEPHQQIVDRLSDKGIKVGKIQISAALKALLPDSTDGKTLVKAAFMKFNEPTYLHQVVAKKSDNSLIRYPDLPEALNDKANEDVVEWRAHFHVPIFMEDFGLVKSTHSDIIEVLNIQKSKPFAQHLEVETYTWEVLPEGLKLPLKESIIREMKWAVEQLAVGS